MDHEDYSASYDIINDTVDDPDDDLDNNRKTGDELLIDLYKERSFLYDKQNKNFKDNIMKSNAWKEISTIMTELHEDDMYTPIYCQKRCNSLRDQYNREKRKALECRSGSGAVKQSSFLYLRQLSFLDKIVKRRRSYTNSSINKNNNNDLLNNLQESNKQVLDEECINTGDTEPNIMKRRKVHETKSLETAFLNMGDTISEYMKKKKTEMDSVDDAFMKYLKLQFDTFSDNEKLIRKKMIMDALVARIE